MSSAKPKVLKATPVEPATARKLRSQSKKVSAKKVVGKKAPAKKQVESAEKAGGAPPTPSNQNNQGKDSPLQLSKEEREFILQARKDGKKAEAYKRSTPQNVTAPAAAVETPAEHPDEAAYARVLGESTILNEVHAHCLDIVRLEPLQLRKYVATALANAKQLSLLPEAREKMRSPIIKALPLMAKKLLKEDGLPVPTSFSTAKVIETYSSILTRYLRITECLLKTKDKRARNVRPDDNESGDSSGGDSDAPDGDEDKNKAKEIETYTKLVEESLRIGEVSYPEPHLYECERLLKSYKEWRDPRDPTERRATIPKEVRTFIKKHLADDAPVLSAYEQKHVKGSQTEQKHVTFLLNEMGFLASKICKERLSRAGKELSREGRIRRGHALSKKEREASIKGEREMAGRVRWFGDLLSLGVSGWDEFKKGTRSKSTQSNLRAAGLFSAEEAKRVAKSVYKSDQKRKRSRSRSTSRRRPRGGRYGRSSRRRYSRERSRDRRGGDRYRNPKKSFRERDRGDKKSGKGPRCWNCNEYGHLVMNCPSAAAGKAPHPDSRFGKARKKNTNKA